MRPTTWSTASRTSSYTSMPGRRRRGDNTMSSVTVPRTLRVGVEQAFERLEFLQRPLHVVQAFHGEHQLASAEAVQQFASTRARCARRRPGFRCTARTFTPTGCAPRRIVRSTVCTTDGMVGIASAPAMHAESWCARRPSQHLGGDVRSQHIEEVRRVARECGSRCSRTAPASPRCGATTGSR